MRKEFNFSHSFFVIIALRNINKKIRTGMAYNKILTDKVRMALGPLPNIEEKRMFSGITFMVDGKMCISVGNDRIMCRIDPEIHEQAILRKACRTVIMKGREYKGYVYIQEEGLTTKEDIDYWVGLALDFNKKAKASVKTEKKG
jgi:TfoX/Sxy family transcriptional regulator of competence genes